MQVQLPWLAGFLNACQSVDFVNILVARPERNSGRAVVLASFDQLVSAQRGPASSSMKNSLPGMVGIQLEVTCLQGP